MIEKTEDLQLFDCLVVGAGPIGLAMARSLDLCGLSYALCGQLPLERPNSPDLRTAALFGGSLRFLKRLGAWPHIGNAATPLSGIRIIDGTGRLLRAPEQLFLAADADEAELGFNVPNPALIEALRTSLSGGASAENLIELDVAVEQIALGVDDVVITLSSGERRRGRMVIAADGRNSIVRRAAEIGVKQWEHGQAAVTAHIDHALSNEGISTEVHGRTGPCTVVPMGQHRASLVWMETADRAAVIAEFDDDAFASVLEERLGGLLGPVRPITPRRVFSLSSLIADRFANKRVALVGESAHAFPPIGAQGLNLGLRDVATLTDHLIGAADAGKDLGSEEVLEGYSTDRRVDILARTYGVEAFNASLSSWPAGLIRGAVLHTSKAAPAFRRFLVDRGLGPIGEWPTMMR